MSASARSLALALALASCAPGRTLDPDATSPIPIGLVVPLAGDFGDDGESWRDAVRLAAREVNAAGGLYDGHPVELVIADSESDAVRGVAAARRLVDEDGVVAIIGDASSASTVAIYQEVTGPARIPLASGLSTTSDLTTLVADGTDPDGYFFRTVAPDDLQAMKLADAMYGEPYGCRRIATLFVEGAYGEPFTAALRARFEALGGVVALEQPFVPDRASYIDEVLAVAEAMPYCVALIAYPQSAGQIVRDWDGLPTRPSWRWFGTDGIRQEGFPDAVGDPVLIDGFLGTAPIQDAATPAYNRFVVAYRASFGPAPVAFGSNLYDAAALMMLAIASARSTDPDLVMRAVHELDDPAGEVVQAGQLQDGLRFLREGRSINYEGASGPVDLDELGNVAGVYELWQYNATLGRFVQIRMVN
jgi:ABC-type branched-subunit amino acid transport system substrate-binding protein